MFLSYFKLSIKTLGASILSLFLSFAILKLQTKFLGLEARGTYIYTIANITILTSLLRFGVPFSLGKIIKDFEIKQVVSSYYLTILIGLVLCSFFIILLIYINIVSANLNPLVLLFFTTSTYLYTSICSISFLINGSKTFAFQVVFVSFLSIINILLFNYLFRIEAKHFFLASSISQLLVSIYLILKLPKFRYTLINRDVIRKLYFNGIKNYGWSTLKDFSYKLDILVFGNIMSASDFGIYSLIQNLTQYLWKFTDPFVSSFQKYLIALPYGQHFNFTKKIIFYLSIFNCFIFLFGFNFITPVFEFIGNVQLTFYKSSILILLASVLLVNYWRIIVNYFIVNNNTIPANITTIFNVAFFMLFGVHVKNLTGGVSIILGLQILNMLLILFYFIRSKNAQNS